jgi:hypothetical protein
MSNEHLNEAAASFARYMLACGADLAYGGRPRLEPLSGAVQPPNFLDLLLDLIRTYHKVAGQTDARLRSFVAEAFSGDFTDAFRSRWKQVIEVINVTAGMPRPIGATLATEGYFIAKSLTAMRKEMTGQTDARILLGGKSSGFQGKYPGLVEEAFLAMDGPNPQPVYLIGGFGGAARAVIDVLEKRSTPVFTRDWQEQKNPKYKAVADLYPENDQVDYQSLVRFFSEKGVAFLSQHNGLTVEDNRRLFHTPNVLEMVYLALLGLGRVLGNQG